MLYTGFMNSKTKWYCWSAVAGLLTYGLLALEMNRELHCWANKDFMTMFFFPLGMAVLVIAAINLKHMRLPVKKYHQRMIFGMIAYVLAVGLMNHLPMPPSPYKYLLVLLPVLPLVFVCNAIIRFVAEGLDELQRKVVTEAFAFSGLATGFTCFSYLFVRDLGAPPLHAEWAFYLMWVYYFVGLIFSGRRYR